jgi:hypothetical protein
VVILAKISDSDQLIDTFINHKEQFSSSVRSGDCSWYVAAVRERHERRYKTTMNVSQMVRQSRRIHFYYPDWQWYKAGAEEIVQNLGYSYQGDMPLGAEDDWPTLIWA